MDISRPPNPHITDPLLHPFLSPTFSPIAYLNDTLPPTNTKPPPTLSSIATQTQTQISTLAAQTTRLSTTLTALTDDILRTSSRLTYEVELLRGEALSLADTLSSRGGLDEAIRKFVPQSLDTAPAPTEPPSSPTQTRQTNQPTSPSTLRNPPLPSPAPTEPEALPHLRTLLHVRSSLQTVIQRFNLALSFPMPPSLLTTSTTSLISVSSPNIDPDLEAKGQAALARFKQEVVEMLERGDVAAARARVRELRDVCEMWRGTSEERARGKWVDALEGVVEEREGRGKASVRPGAVQRDESAVKGVETSGSVAGPGFLRRLRDEIYME